MISRILIKIGGRACEGEQGFKQLATAIKSIGQMEIVIVHGGGTEISQALKNAKHKTQFIDGIRVTRADDIKIIETVLSKKINHRIASKLEKYGVPCSCLSGRSKRLLVVEPLTRHGQDFGYVGKIKQVNTEVVLESLNAGQVPVVSPISANQEGQSYNVNADSAAAAIAAAIQCTDLVFVTDVPGVLVDGEIRPSLSIQQSQVLIADGIIKGGMVAKMESAFEALNRGVPQVHIIQWQGVQTLHDIIKGQSGSGTTVTP